jgi:hypothetical protein
MAAKKTPISNDDESKPPRDLKEYKRRVQKRIEEIKTDPDSEGWLKELYKVHADGFKGENDRIWETGKIIVPVSFAAFGAFAQLKDKGLLEVAVFGFGSTSLLLLWHLIARSHRHFQDAHRTWTEEIELVMHRDQKGSGTADAKTKTSNLETPKNKVGMPRIRRILLWTVGSAWVLIGLYVWQNPPRPDQEPSRLEGKLK